jgi:putative acetyltransferase
MNVQIRPETDADKAAVFGINAAAFPTDAEAKLVDSLRISADPYVSLVAVEDQDVVGHILFTPVTLEPFDDLDLMGLAPMAVSPSRQRGGIGTELVNAGLQRCRELGIGAVAVLGHPEYYPRFGFRPSSEWGIRSEYDVPEEVFMMLELSPDYLQNKQGTIRYHAAFADV